MAAVKAGLSEDAQKEMNNAFIDQEHPVNYAGNDIEKGAAELRAAAEVKDIKEQYREIEKNAVKKYSNYGLSEEEAIISGRVEADAVRMQAARHGLTPQLAAQSLDISFNQELNEADSKIKFVQEIQTLDEAEQREFWAAAKETAYPGLERELREFRERASGADKATVSFGQPPLFADELFRPKTQEINTFKQEFSAALQTADNVNKKINMGSLPFLYKLLGFTESELKTNKKAMLKALGRAGKNLHNVPLEVLENLPQLTADPVAVLKSLSTSDNPNGYVAVLNAKVGDAPVLAILSPSKDGKGFAFIPTVYEKNNFNNLFKNTAEEGGVLYIKDKGSELWGTLQSRPRHIQNLNNSIQTQEDIFKTYRQDARMKVKITSKEGFVKAVVEAVKNPDKSSFIHEMSHIWLEVFQGVYNHAEYQEMRRDMDKWLGKPRGGVYSEKQQEKFAKGFEEFLKEGKAPAPYLQAVFDRFRAWLVNIYGSVPREKMSEAARSVYARLLAGENADMERSVAKSPIIRLGLLNQKSPPKRGFLSNNTFV